MLTNVGIGRIGIRMRTRNLEWNRLDRDQLGIDKIGWELGWITTKEEVGIGIQ